MMTHQDRKSVVRSEIIHLSSLTSWEEATRKPCGCVVCIFSSLKAFLSTHFTETIYPSENGSSSIPPEKLQKLIAKGQIPAQTTNEVLKTAGMCKYGPPIRIVQEENLDGDMDTIVDNAIREVWNFYDPKGLGYMDKKKVKQFFNDAVRRCESWVWRVPVNT